jgi:hypothetical protein
MPVTASVAPISTVPGAMAVTWPTGDTAAMAASVDAQPTVSAERRNSVPPLKCPHAENGWVAPTARVWVAGKTSIAWSVAFVTVSWADAEVPLAGSVATTWATPGFSPITRPRAVTLATVGSLTLHTTPGGAPRDVLNCHSTLAGIEAWLGDTVNATPPSAPFKAAELTPTGSSFARSAQPHASRVAATMSAASGEVPTPSARR